MKHAIEFLRSALVKNEIAEGAVIDCSAPGPTRAAALAPIREIGVSIRDALAVLDKAAAKRDEAEAKAQAKDAAKGKPSTGAGETDASPPAAKRRGRPPKESPSAASTPPVEGSTNGRAPGLFEANGAANEGAQ